MEFGSRRAQGTAAAIVGARAAYIGGCMRHGLHHHRPALRRARARHDGPRLGADVRHRVRRLQDLLRDLSRTTPSCWWTPTTRSKSGIPNAIRAFNEVLQPAGHHQVRHPPRQRRHRLPFPQGAQNARRGRLDRLRPSPFPTRSTSTSSSDLLDAGREDRSVRRRRAAHHRAQRAGVRLRLQARRRRG